MAVYLDDYPIHSSDEACSRYMAAIDWRLVSQEIETNGVSCFDVSDTLPLFPHLTLDDDYILFCYVTREYHGLWGRVAALQKDTPSPPVNVQPKGPLGLSFELPDAAVPPMEAIYNDGSPAGFLEALLAAEFFSALPYVCFQYEHWDRCVFSPPEHYQTEWEHYMDLADWRPRLIQNGNEATIYVCQRHFENGLSASDGRDRIYLAQYDFQTSLNMYLFFASKAVPSLYKSHLRDGSRYHESKRCCVASSQQILIAKQFPK